MGVLALLRLFELDSAFHITLFSMVSVIPMKHWLFLRNFWRGYTWSFGCIDWQSGYLGVYPVLATLVFEHLAITVAAVPAEPLDTANREEKFNIQS